MASRSSSLFGIALVGLASLLSLVAPAVLAQVNVWTQHNGNARSGANLAEVQLNTSNVNPSQFGKLFQYSVDAPVFAQPLVITNLSIPNKGMRNVVFVATMNNSVYAFDADDPSADQNQPIWQVSFNNPAAGITSVPSADISANLAYSGPYGVMGTPVIDQASGTLYLVARTKENGTYHQRLHALDIATGQERPGSSVDISATVTNQDGSTTTFNTKKQNQRPALALANGRVYISWASQEDGTPYQGWIIAYDAITLQQAGVFNSAPTGGMAGIWMSGQGPAVDASGNLYVVTGNGAWDGVTNFAQSILKLSASLSLLDWFTPDNWQITSLGDADLGSSGAMLIPGTPYVISGSKEGKLYLVNTTNMGHMVAGNTQIPQVFQSSNGNNIHGTPVFWSGPTGMRIYVWPETDFLKAYAFGGQSLNTSPVSQSTFWSPPGMPGGVLSLSANGNVAGTGIVWASLPLSQDANPQSVPGVLRAFDASDLTKQLWNSENKCPDEIGTYAKFVPPTVANGKVYLPTFSNQLLVYGLLSTLPSANPGLVGSVNCDSSNVDLTAVGTLDWAKWPSYVHKASGAGRISNYSAIGTGTAQVASYTRVMTWSDGTPVASGSDQSGVVVAGNGNGFQISAPADTTPRTLYLYVSGSDSGGRLVAHLSDGSAPDYVNALSGAGNYDVVYTLTYKAASAGQQLIATWIQASDTGTVTLRAAALSLTTSPPPPPPTTPTGVSASNGTSANSVTVSWSASTNATSYTVYRSASSGTLGSSVGTTNTTSLTDTTVVPGTLYFYAVVASGAGGNSVASAQVSGYAAASPPAPTGISASDGTSATSVAVSWSASTGATSYTVYRSSSAGPLGSTLGTSGTTSFADTTVTPGTVYYYAVVASGVGGNSAPSAQDSGYAAAPPLAPTGVAASDGTSASSVTVNWSASTGATSYAVYRSTSSGTLGSSVGTSTITTFTDTTVTPGTVYYYSVVASGVGGNSAPSAQNSGYAAAPPPSPVGVSASDGTSASSVTVSWSASPGATSYTVYRSSSAGPLGNALGASSTISFTDTTVTPGTAYYYSVGASGAGGTSTPSAQDSGYAAAPPLAPTGVAASKGTSATSVTLSWSASAGATSYAAYRSTSSGTLGSSIGTSIATSLVDSTVVPGAIYYYTVVAIGVGGNSALSTQVSGFASSSSSSSFAALAAATSDAVFRSATATTLALAGGGSLIGSTASSSATVDITAAGSTDWAKWPNYIHKATGGGQISTYATIGSVSVQPYTNDLRALTWSDGMPMASGSDQAGLYVAGFGTGFRIATPADTTTRTLYFYVGGAGSSGVLIAHLSDGSAPDYVQSAPSATGQYDIVYTITYRAASTGQQLFVSWTQASSAGNVTLQGAALK